MSRAAAPAATLSALRAPVPRGDDTGDIAIEHWDDLFHAVLDRLTQTMAQLDAPAALTQCIEALKQLHATRSAAGAPKLRGRQRDPGRRS